jgi:hypothetical protein
MENDSSSFGSSGAASLGGKARAEKLTAEQRKAIGQRAALARWGGKKVPRAIKEAPLKIGEIEFECAVLEDSENIDTATRVISERAFSRAIGAKRGGSHWQRKKKNPGGANLPVFLSANNLKPFISLDLAVALSEPIVYLSEGGPAYGIKAELIPQILDVWLKARDADKLTERQKPFAKLAEILARGLMTTGLIALIDEATGVQKLRSQQALAKFLEAYIAKELRKYAPAFPLTWFQEVCRLKGIPFPEDMKLPRYFGHIVNDLVWDRLAPGIKDELRKKNPVLENGRRKDRHHQWLTEELGNPKLLHHLGILEGLARGHADGKYDQYHQQVDIVLPSYRRAPLLAYAKDQRAGNN